jgi:hypothetical protein
VMPTFTVLAGNLPHFEEVDGCSNYYFRGLNFTNPSNLATTNGWFDFSPGGQTALANYPDEIVIQQCLFDGGTGNMQRAIIGMARRIAVMDNYATNIGSAPGIYETQFFQASAGPGPYRIVNNYLNIGGNGENMMWGGSPLVGTDATFLPSDIEVRGNLLTKPLTGYGGNGGDHKNHFEIKFGRRILFEGNICRDHNGRGQDRSVVVKLTAQSTSGSAEVQTNNITIRFNKITNAIGGIGISSREDNPPGVHETTGVEVTQNLVYDLTPGVNNDKGFSMRVAAGVTDCAVQYNTLLANASLSLVNCIQLNSSADQIHNLDIQYNLMAGSDSVPARNVRSVTGLGSGEVAFAAHTDTGTFASNLVVGGATEYPNQTRVAARANLGFTDLANDNYILTTSSAGYHAGASNQDWGCSVAMLNTILTGVE